MASASASVSNVGTSANVGASTNNEVLEVIPTTRCPEVWQHFDLCRMQTGPNKARCKYCGKFYKKDANTSLGNHISVPHCKALKGEPSKGQTSLASEGTMWAYNVEAVREQMGNFVIQESLPFNHFDNPRLTKLIQKTLQPRYTHVSRATLRRDCLKRWKQAKVHMISYFENLQTGVNLTSDVWSSPHGSPDSYICVTAHWVEPSSWQMMKRTIAFQLFDYPHTGENIFHMIDKVIQTYKLQDKILSISFDNASNNGVAVSQLKLKYDPICEGAFFHSRCVAHIINLAVQEGLKQIDAQKSIFKRMLRDIFSMTARHSKFIKFCVDAGKTPLGPNWDVPTRWNSTCNMFEKAISQKENLIAFHQTLSSRGKVAPYPSGCWYTIEVITQMLQVFKNATTALSGVYYPTSSIALHKIYLISRKLSEMKERGQPFSDMVPPMLDKLRKYFADLPAVFTCAAALNPWYNVNGVENLIQKIANELELNTPQDPFFSQNLQSKFQNQFSTMFDVYLTRYGETTHIQNVMRNTSFQANDPDMDVIQDIWDDANKRQRGNTPSSELGRYMGSNFLSGLGDFKSFDLLAWWKDKENQFPILAAMARDLLTVQDSTVASESAFSTSGRIISIRRTRLTPKAVEMSICLKDYLDAAERIQDKRSLEGELEYEAQLYENEVDEGLTEGMTDEEAIYDEYLRNSSGED